MSEYERRFTARRRDPRERKYNDGLLFDTLRPHLPNPQRSGKRLLLASFGLQLVVVLLGFLMHHHRKPEFGCCNIWAVVIALFFVALQWPYYSDWCSKLGGQAHWHRANMFVPFFVFSVVFIMWLGGVLSLLAHAEGKEFFELEWGLLSGVEVLSFIVMTSCMFVLVWIYVSLAVAHRNNLGTHYYAPGESEVSLVHLKPEAETQHGSFNYRNLLGLMTRVVGLETSLAAERNVLTVMAVGVAVQVPFYLFAGLAYGQDNQSALLMSMIVIGLVVVVLSAQRFYGAIDRRHRRLRKWNRGQLFFPLYVMFVVVWAYFFTMSTIFFQVEDPNRLWEDILLDGGLTSTEIAYFSLSVVNLFCLLAVQLLVANLHRKAWAEGTGGMDDGLLYGPPNDQGQPTHTGVGAEHVELYDMDVQRNRGSKDAAAPVPSSSSSAVAVNKGGSRVRFEDSDSDDDDDDADIQLA